MNQHFIFTNFTRLESLIYEAKVDFVVTAWRKYYETVEYVINYTDLINAKTN